MANVKGRGLCAAKGSKVPFKGLCFSTGLLASLALLGPGLRLQATAESPKPRPALTAKTVFEIDQSTPAQTQELLSGPVKAVINFKKAEDSTFEYPFSYQLFYSGLPKSSFSAKTSLTGSIQLQDLTNDKVPEVIVTTYSGGAHCCNEYTIHGWEQNRFTTVKTGPLDGGGTFKDLDGDGKVEFITVDNAFFYAFSSFAGSFPPTQIYQYHPGRLVNVTRRYPKVLRSGAWQMFQAVTQTNGRTATDINGVLAGYVAQKILLGEFQDGWNFMMARYNSKDDWGLEKYQGTKVVGKYPNFPIALRAFLIKTGYLDKQGLPVKRDS